MTERERWIALVRLCAQSTVNPTHRNLAERCVETGTPPDETEIANDGYTPTPPEFWEYCKREGHPPPPEWWENLK